MKIIGCKRSCHEKGSRNMNEEAKTINEVSIEEELIILNKIWIKHGITWYEYIAIQLWLLMILHLNDTVYQYICIAKVHQPVSFL